MLHFETLAATDLDQIVACWASSAIFDPCDASLLYEKIFGDEAVPPEFRFAVHRHDSVVGLCVACIRRQGKSDRGYVKLLAVDPRIRRQGTGSALLGHAEDLLAAAGVAAIRISESAPNYLLPGVDQRDAATVAFFESRGYQAIGEACNMHVDLTLGSLIAAMDEARLANRAGAYDLRRATTQDIPSVDRFIRLHWAAWASEVAQTFLNSPISLHIAQNEVNRVVGFSAYDANNRGTGWFGPMGTDPACQGMGIGRLLLLKCLDDIRAQGHSAAIIPWVAPVEFYQKHAGATISRRFVRLEKQVL